MSRRREEDYEDDDESLDVPVERPETSWRKVANRLIGFRSPNTGAIVLLCDGCRKKGVTVPGHIYAGEVDEGRCRNCRAEM